MRGEMIPGEEDDWEDDEEDLEGEAERTKAGQQESQVGKRLSELTTRRVILVILGMLIAMPLLEHSAWLQESNSAQYGASNVGVYFQAAWDADKEQNHTGSINTLAHQAYEDALLRYIFYHPFTVLAGQVQFTTIIARLYWIGVVSPPAYEQRAREMASLTSTKVREWGAEHATRFGTLTSAQHAALALPWDLDCSKGESPLFGIALMRNELKDAAVCPQDLRNQEKLRFQPQLTSADNPDQVQPVFYFDLRPFIRDAALNRIFLTLFIMCLLVWGAVMFTSDANRVVVQPVENMIKRVEMIRADPLIAIKMADEEFKNEMIAKSNEARQKKEVVKTFCFNLLTCSLCGAENNEPMETVILEKTIIKLGSLLVLGFGEAGAGIIGHNLRGADSAGVNAMVPGTRLECVIGMARVCDFSVAVEVLQSKIMNFVNQISEIVHGVCSAMHGAPNKNLGETFLVIWRMEQPIVSLESSEDPEVLVTPHSRRVAEMSVVAFAKVLGALHESPVLATYRGHPGLQYKMHKQSNSKYRVNLSFGLHRGWAIEGAVGSEFKIDASYLSPNVSIASSVERATTIYGVQLIVAQSVVEICDKSIMSKCRLIDHVLITGSVIPMELYCVDLDYLSVEVSTDKPLTTVWNTRNRYKARQFLEFEKSSKLSGDGKSITGLFDTDPVLKTMRERYTTEFLQLFNMGYENYVEGEWEVAKHHFNRAQDALGARDGPSAALLRYMQLPYKFEAPRTWRGVRELDHRSLDGYS